MKIGQTGHAGFKKLPAALFFITVLIVIRNITRIHGISTHIFSNVSSTYSDIFVHPKKLIGTVKYR